MSDPAPNPVGRPSMYRPEYCGMLVDLMATGLSLTASMAQIGFSRQRAHEWAEAHLEFRDAIALGHGKRSLFLETRGISAESGPAVTFVIAALKNCNVEDFRDRKEVEHSGPDGGPISLAVSRIERVIVEPNAANPDS